MYCANIKHIKIHVLQISTTKPFGLMFTGAVHRWSCWKGKKKTSPWNFQV